MTTIRPAASIALFSGSSVLLIRRAFMPRAGYWTLPGGRLEPGEDAKTCIRREIREELDLTFADAVFVMDQLLPGFRLSIFAACLAPDVQPRPNAEIAGWIWHQTGTALPDPHTEGLAEVLARAHQTLV